jgi:hypothetical protein
MPVDRDTAPAHIVYGKANPITDIRCHGLEGDRLYGPTWVDERRLPYTGTKGFIDTSGGGDDSSGITIIGHSGGFLYVKCCEAVPSGFQDPQLDKLSGLLRKHGADEVYLEDNYGGEMFAALFSPRLRRFWLEPGQNPLYPKGWKCSIVSDKRVTHALLNKGTRIVNDLHLVTSQHRMVWDVSVAANAALQHQFTRMREEIWGVRGAKQRRSKALFGGVSPAEVDSLSGCARAWTHELDVDPEVVKRQMDLGDVEAEIASLRDYLRLRGVRSKRRELPAPNWLRHGRRR